MARKTANVSKKGFITETLAQERPDISVSPLISTPTLSYVLNTPATSLEIKFSLFCLELITLEATGSRTGGRGQWSGRGQYSEGVHRGSPQTDESIRVHR